MDDERLEHGIGDERLISPDLTEHVLPVQLSDETHMSVMETAGPEIEEATSFSDSLNKVYSHDDGDEQEGNPDLENAGRLAA